MDQSLCLKKQKIEKDEKFKVVTNHFKQQVFQNWLTGHNLDTS